MLSFCSSLDFWWTEKSPPTPCPSKSASPKPSDLRLFLSTRLSESNLYYSYLFVSTPLLFSVLLLSTSRWSSPPDLLSNKCGRIEIKLMFIGLSCTTDWPSPFGLMTECYGKFDLIKSAPPELSWGLFNAYWLNIMFMKLLLYGTILSPEMTLWFFSPAIPSNRLLLCRS